MWCHSLLVLRAAGSTARLCAPTAALSTEWSSEPRKDTRDIRYKERSVMKKVIVITGASSGFGRLSANALAKAGHTVYASMRDTAGRNAPQVADVRKFAHDNKVDLRPIELDVSSEKSIEAAIRQIVAEQGRLDVLMHNAGHMVFGPAEAFTPEQLAELYDINVISTQRVNRVALPQMRKQRQGLLIWVSSSSSAGGTPPYLAPYFASKAGMDAMAVQYARELALWGIETSIPRLLYRVRLPEARTISRIPALPRTKPVPLNTTPARTRAMGRKFRKPLPRLFRPMRTRARSPKRSLLSWMRPSASVHFAYMSIRHRTEPT